MRIRVPGDPVALPDVCWRGWSVGKSSPGHNTSARRQDQPAIYRLNGAIYLARIDRLLETEQFVDEFTIAYEMPENRSIVIDNAADFEQFRTTIEGART